MGFIFKVTDINIFYIIYSFYFIILLFLDIKIFLRVYKSQI